MASIKINKHNVNEIPNACPMCHIAIRPEYIKDLEGVEIDSGSKRLQIVFLCTNNDCKRFFVATYHTRRTTESLYWLSDTGPTTALQRDWGKHIRKLSPMFCRIHGQAAEAEARGLEQIAGMGYGKALEFLIKDYAIEEHPDEEEQVRKAWIGACIDNYVDDAKVEMVAKRAIWLRNDETHYTRVWEDRDVDDLKNLIAITVNFIESGVIAKEYEKEMSDS